MTKVKEQEGTPRTPGNLNVPEDCRAVSEVLSRVGDKWTVLVVGKLPKGGIARVFLGKEKLGTVRFKGETGFSTLRTFRLDEPRKGKLRIVVAKNKPIRIEGVAVVND